jgi:hypothetical protein
MSTLAKISEDSLKLVNYLKDIEHGQILSYQQIEKDTGVKMNTQTGRSYLRTACKKLRREYSCLRGIGIQLASVNTATTLVVGRLVKIDNAVKRGERTYNNVSLAFYNELAPEEQKQLNFVGAAFGAIRVAAENGKYFLKNIQKGIITSPVLPENMK